MLLDGDGGLVWSNAAAREYAGIDGGRHEHLLEKLASRLHPVEESSTHPLALAQLRVPGSEPRDVLCRYGPDESRWLRIEVTHIPVAGKSAVLLRLRDVSEERRSQLERRRLEQRVGESRRLESLGKLTGGIAHDFNNLLTVILGNATLLAAELPRGSEAWDQLGRINAASLHAADLVKQMLLYAGRAPAVAVPVDLSKVIAESRPLLGRCLPEGARLTLDLAAELPEVHGDPSQLHQAIVNLVDNAAEALEGTNGRGGHVHVRTRVVMISNEELAGAVIGSDQRPGERILIEVSDNGAGIDEDSAGATFRVWLPTTKPPGQTA